ncbi:MAG TPA: YkgJ family cysteine cluster protein, partial [Kofleriaceae bacterium]|nr:YkgJ family cysteine cluster protein [Kofleriaceae bacterium]
KLDERGDIREESVLETLPERVREARVADETAAPLRIELSDHQRDKYAVAIPPVPCAELLPICKARCCTLPFRLSTQDLDGGHVRWDYGRPYWNLRRPDGYCVHNDSDGHGCGVYQERPAPCRAFDCRGDDRIWLDFEKRIPAPVDTTDVAHGSPKQPRMEVENRAALRHIVMDIEGLSLRRK